MSPEQEYVYINWKRIFWTAMVPGNIPAILLLKDENSDRYCVWAQDDLSLSTIFFDTLDSAIEQVEQSGVREFYPRLRITIS